MQISGHSKPNTQGTHMENQDHWYTVHWKRTFRQILRLSLILLPLTILATTVYNVGMHHLRIERANGVWCVDFYEDGHMERLYGEDCEVPSETGYVKKVFDI